MCLVYLKICSPPWIRAPQILIQWILVQYSSCISWDFWIKYNDLTISASESCVGHFLDIGSPDWVILPSFGSSWIRQDGCYGKCRLTPWFLDQPGMVLEWKILCKNWWCNGRTPMDWKRPNGNVLCINCGCSLRGKIGKVRAPCRWMPLVQNPSQYLLAENMPILFGVLNA